MSIFSKIASAEHTFAAYVEKELEKIEGEAPEIERVIDATLDYAGPALQLALSLTGNTVAAAAVGPIIAEAHKDLAVASALVYDFGPNPTAASMFKATAADLSGLLTAGHVTNATSIAAVTKVVANVGSLGSAVQLAAAAIAASATAPATPAAATAAPGAVTAATSQVSPVRPA